jgi:hypothetical protein
MNQQPTTRKLTFSTRIVIPFLVIVVAVAAFFRFYRLHEIPPGFTFDEAGHALDALDILKGQHRLISARFVQGPMGYMYLLAPVFQIFGPKPLAQRILTATFSLLLVPVSFGAVWILFREALGSKKARLMALFTAMLLASSFWSAITGRVGYEYILAPVFALLAVCFFWPAYRVTNQRLRWGMLLAASFLTVVGSYLYEGASPFILVIPTSILLNALIRRVWPTVSSQQGASIHWRALLFFSVMAGLMMLPLFLALVTGEEPEVRRTTGKLIFKDADNLADSLNLLLNSILAHAQPFLGLNGDRYALSNLPWRPILNPVLAVFFVSGLLLSLWRFRQLPYLFLLVYWAAMLTPAVLTFRESPFYFRMTSALPPTYMFVALSWIELYGWLETHLASWGKMATRLALFPFLIMGLIWQPFETYRDYFLRWADRPDVAEVYDAPGLILIERMTRETNPESIFIIPSNTRRSGQIVEPRPNYTLEFLYHGQTPLCYIHVRHPDVRQNLTETLANYRTVHLIADLTGGSEPNADREDLLPFLFEKYGQLQNREKTDAYTILTYQLDSKSTDFEAHRRPPNLSDFESLSGVIADQVKLIGSRRQLTDDVLSLDLAWQTLSRVSQDYTVFVQLLDQNGQRVAGVDVLPERGFSTLDSLETMVTHYAIPLPDDMKPGSYTILIGLYHFTEDGAIQNDGTITLAEPVTL